VIYIDISEFPNNFLPETKEEMSRIISPVFCGEEKFYLRFFLSSLKQPERYFVLFYFGFEKMAMMTEFNKLGQVKMVVKKHLTSLTALELIIGSIVIVEN
jgi:hypothetical protein